MEWEVRVQPGTGLTWNRRPTGPPCLREEKHGPPQREEDGRSKGPGGLPGGGST